LSPSSPLFVALTFNVDRGFAEPATTKHPLKKLKAAPTQLLSIGFQS